MGKKVGLKRIFGIAYQERVIHALGIGRSGMVCIIVTMIAKTSKIKTIRSECHESVSNIASSH